MIGTLLSHYRILERLGAGGMGVVYRARDERLDRDVALKVLPDGLIADEPVRRRFHREALAAARITHPNVGVIYDFDSVGSVDFLVMEFVPGESLDRAVASGALPEPAVLETGSALADALAALHEIGVIHCDLKPANVVRMPNGRPKLLDFGLSRLLRVEGAHRSRMGLSDTGAGWAGTLPYMAPEQFTGARLDARTDLYALGVLLFELATGRTPHVAAEPAALMYAIVHQPPPQARSIVPALSPGFDALLAQALEKAPEHRFATAVAFRSALRDLQRDTHRERSAAPARPRIRGLAVLPLANLSADPEQEFFADGMTEALLTDLASIEGLRLISRTSVMRFKGTTKSLREIAAELEVDAVVEGSVLRAGGHVRISAQLVDAAGDRSLWAKSYERPLGDVLALQREVARAIAEEIRSQLTPREAARLISRPAVPPEAHDAYLRGRFLWNRRTTADVQRALEYFRRAAELAPDYAAAHGGIADAIGILGDLDVLPPEQVLREARAAADLALKLEPERHETLTTLGFLACFFTWEWETAEQAFRRSIAAGPNYATAHQWYGEFLATQGRFVEGEREARQALALDPLSVIMASSLGDVLYFARRYHDAIEVLRQSLDMDPNFPWALTDLGRLLTEIGDYDGAIAAFKAAQRVLGVEGKSWAGLAYANARAGRTDEARSMLADLERRLSPAPAAAGRHAIGLVHLALGHPEPALDWLERAHREGDRAMVWIREHPRLDPLRGEPRLQRLIDAMHFPAAPAAGNNLASPIARG